ncbi:FAD-dependent oxidoreductase [Microbacterium dauci]|uniref:FAD-dependent oxidoreductase n=1 Tax=Microbacterium dauci TaxID=3048008 RepID=A0ABT6ZE84_9MICO|nr:FAD-dependent oxidoreductase [Microbacterium sp. LX3-4]MDJ1114473.1 FAD-dependent oxidoreductase [Microbacterium sp. LX3-4]
MRDRVDVLVVGGGPAGISAAAQAARLGLSTGLVEKNGALGGTTVVAGVALPGLFHAWGRQVIAGIGWDIVRRSVDVAGGELPDFSRWEQPHWKLQVPVSPGIYASVIDEALDAARVDLLLHTMIGAVEWTGSEWVVTLCCKEGLRTVRAGRLIDCTGDADVVAHAGLARRQNPEMQPGTLMVRLGGYDHRELRGLDIDALDASFDRAVADGRLLAHDFQTTDRPMRSFLRNRGENKIHITGIHGGTSADRTEAELAGRRTLLRIFRFLRAQPGLEALTLDAWAIETGVREAFTIDGLVEVTHDDYWSGRRWPDGLSNSFYPIDVHRSDGDGIDIRRLPYGVIPSIPLRAMVPADAPGSLIVAGRSICGDQEANSAYRVQASCMAMGQAAGAVAAISLLDGTRVEDISIERAHQVLRAHGAIIPGDVAIDDHRIDPLAHPRALAS